MLLFHLGFRPRRLQVRFVEEHVALEQVFSDFFGFPVLIIIPPFLHIHVNAP
jgi:hypothetical protein